MIRQTLQLQLAINQPSLKDYQIIKYANKYVDTVMNQIAKQFLTVTSDELDSGEISFAADDVYQQCGQAMIAGQRVRIYTMMQAEANTSLVLQQYQGNSITNRVSKITFNPQYKNAIYKDLMENDYLLNDAYLDKLAKKENQKIPVDMDTLDSYIENTRQALTKSRAAKYTQKLCRNLLAAKQVKHQTVLQADGSYMVNEYWETIDSGRMHGHGASLQRVAKEVRHAALGRCARIDFKASSYAILTSLALGIDKTIKVEALKDYIKNRTPIRNRIAKKIGISAEWMKTIFTAIGFGAVLKNNSYNSIRKKLGKEKYALLIANEEFMEIKRALDVVRNTVLMFDVFKCDSFNVGNFTYNTLDSKTQKKRSKNQKLAWIYQACERYALDIMISKLPKKYDMLLPVHDCLYIKQSLSSQVVLDLKFEIREIFPLLDFEQEFVFPIHAAADHNKFGDSIAQEDAHHKRRMAEEEITARDYVSEYIGQSVSSPSKPDHRNESNADYERRRWFESIVSSNQHKTEQETYGYRNDSDTEHDSGN